MKRVAALTLGCAAWLAALGISPAPADELTVGSLPYEKITILEVQDGKIRFTMPGYSAVTKNLDQVTRIALSGDQAFNLAEELFAKGEYDKALIGYDTAAEKTSSISWRKDLIAARREVAIKKSSEPRNPTPATAAVVEQRCYWCKGTGQENCPDCNGTGIGRCMVCGGKGKLPCPTCNGNWGFSCRACAGTGFVARASGGSGIFTRMETVRCGQCEGGKIWSCRDCYNAHREGFIQCSECKGSTRAGDCPKCGGDKKVPCHICKAAEAKLASASTRPKEGAAAVRAAIADIYNTLDSFQQAMQNDPASTRNENWNKMTALQKEEALKTLENMRAQYKGKRVKWLLKLDDVVKTGSGNYRIKAVSDSGNRMFGDVAAGAKADLLKLQKGDKIEVNGGIKTFGYASSRYDDTYMRDDARLSDYDSGGSHFIVQLTEASVRPASPPGEPAKP